QPFAVFGLGLDEHPRACEPAFGEAAEQTVGEFLGRERGDVDAFRGRVEFGLFDEIGRRRHEHRRPGGDPPREIVKAATGGTGPRPAWAGTAAPAPGGRRRRGRSRLASRSSPTAATGRGARTAAAPPAGTTRDRRAARRAANTPSAMPIRTSAPSGPSASAT